MKNKKQHYFLACAQVAWRMDETTDNLSMGTVNAIMAVDSPYLRQFNLAQLNGQMVNNMSQMIGQRIDPNLVASVTIMSINSLGFMSEEEFRAQPSQMQVEKEVREVISQAEAEEAQRVADRTERA